MPDFVFLDNSIIPAAEAKISVFDHCFLYGDGLFETMRAFGLRVLMLDEHLDRLFRSAEAMQMKLPWERNEIAEFLQELLKANKLEHSAIRITVSRGEGPPIPDPDVCARPSIVITCREAAPLTGAVYDKGVEVALLATRRTSIQAVPVTLKTCNFLNNITAKQELKTLGAYEGLMLNAEGFLTEGTVSNFFFVKEGVLHTPNLECGLLDGVTRRKVLWLGKKAEIPVREGRYRPEFLDGATEAFLTNSVSLVTPVNKLDNLSLSGVPGEFTSKFRKRMLELCTGNDFS